MKKIIGFLFIATFSVIHANQAVSDSLAKRLNAIHSISATFYQVVKSGHRVVDRSQGVFYLQKPGQFRLDIKRPTPQLIVSDGKTLWIYDKDLEQVTKKNVRNGISGTPALFLSGYSKTILKNYRLSLSAQGNAETYQMKPIKTEGDYQAIGLTFKGESLTTITIKDKLAQTTSLKLSNLKTNLKLSKGLFAFSPPKGVDVVTE